MKVFIKKISQGLSGHFRYWALCVKIENNIYVLDIARPNEYLKLKHRIPYYLTLHSTSIMGHEWVSSFVANGFFFGWQ